MEDLTAEKLRRGRDLTVGDVLVIAGTGGVERQEREIVHIERVSGVGRLARLDDARPGPAEAMLGDARVYRIVER